MKLLNKSVNNLSNMKTYEILFVVLLVLYLVSGVATPYNLAPYVNNLFSYVSLVAIVFVLFLYSNPLLAIFFGIVALVLVNRSRKVDHNVMKPSQENKNAALTKLNSHLKVKSLEEEVVGQVEKKPDNIPGPSSYHPVLCKTHNASQV